MSIQTALRFFQKLWEDDGLKSQVQALAREADLVFDADDKLSLQISLLQQPAP